MRQWFAKAVFDIGWNSSEHRIGLGGEGSVALADTFGADYAKIVIPVNGTISHLNVWSPAGTHPPFSLTLFVNGVATPLTTSLTAIQSYNKNAIHVITVVAGDDAYFSLTGSGTGSAYTLGFSIIFEGAQEIYSIAPTAGGQDVGIYHTGGALGNGRWAGPSFTNQYSNTYSICTTPGTLTGIRMKNYAGNTGGGWTTYVIKNKVLQDGTGGTVNTACTLADGAAPVNNSFSLPIAIGDHVDLALLRTGTNAPFALAQIAASVTFNPLDGESFIVCGGSNNANDNANTEYRWMHSKQLTLTENLAQCPATATGLIITGLYTEVAPPGSGKSVTYTLRKNNADTPAVVTVSNLATSASITGLTIDFTREDLISLKAVPVGNPALGNGMWWGLSVKHYTDRSGLYYLVDSSHDRYYGQVNMKIPDPTIKTAIVGE